MRKRRTKFSIMQSQRNKKILEIECDVKCPYFQTVTSKSVVCKSVIKNANNLTKFDTKEHMENFNQKFCCDLKFMEKCPQYKLLTLYYNIMYAKKEQERIEKRIKEKVAKKQENRVLERV